MDKLILVFFVFLDIKSQISLIFQELDNFFLDHLLCANQFVTTEEFKTGIIIFLVIIKEFLKSLSDINRLGLDLAGWSWLLTRY